MITPAGKECPFFYGDYHRGHTREECRLLKDHKIEWSPTLCRACLMPGIYQANNCEYLRFTPKITPKFLVFGKRVSITTYCQKSKRPVDEPKIGCGECHPLLGKFIVTQDDNNTPS